MRTLRPSAAPAPAAVSVRRAAHLLLGALTAAAIALPMVARAQRLADRPPAVDAARADDATAAPDPRLTPDDVVGIVLDALSHSSANERELAVVFAFASPSNRAVVGTIDRLRDLTADDAYRPLVGHVRAVRGAMKVDGDRATQRIIVTSLAGMRVVYTFSLSRQADGAYKGCWMTDGVTREPPSNLSAPRTA